jgi:protein-disulfide isomerase
VKTLSLLVTLVVSASFIAGCSPSADALKKKIEENPEILFNAIEKHPAKFMDVVNKAVSSARRKQAENEQQKMEKQREDEFKNPKKPKIDEKRAILGPKNAPIVIVEYSDFECPYCSRGYKSIKAVKKKYGDKVRFIYKHLPLDFHKLAMPAAKYFEAIALQSTEKAYKFHDELYENRSKLLAEKEGYLKKLAKKVGANMTKLAKDVESEEVKKRIEDDLAEARKFEFSGTPGFLINGISLRGAYPPSEFEKIIEKILKK